MSATPVYFSTSGPVSGDVFYDRDSELEALLGAVLSLRHQLPRYYALLGKRKVGKSSLLAQFRRRLADDTDVAVVSVDCELSATDPRSFFEDMAVQVIEAFLIRRGLSAQIGSLSGARLDEAAYLGVLGALAALKQPALERGVRALQLLHTGGGNPREAFRAVADLPEQLAKETGLAFVVLLDEFQTIARLNAFKETKTTITNVFDLFRATWQGHRRTGYIISGSEISLLNEILHTETSPFFQHFNTLLVEEFAPEAARGMVRELFERSNRRVRDEQVTRLVELLNGHPFYLQIAGEELCNRTTAEESIGDEMLKAALQDLLFSAGGRLYLYFEGQHQRVIGSSGTLEQTLVAIAEDHHTLSTIAAHLKRAPNAVAGWLGRLVAADVVVKAEGGYQVADPVYAMWLRSVKSPLRLVSGPFFVGTEAERRVAERLGREGFQLVFQARASRGAFDLLAILGAQQIGLQVKQVQRLPAYLSRQERQRMSDWAKRLGWLAVLCVCLETEVLFFQLGDLTRTGKGYRADRESAYDSLLALLAAASG